jgi:hypothetical protein
MRRRGPPLGSTGFRGIHVRPYDTYAANISGGDMHVWIGTYHSPEEATHIYDIVAWMPPIFEKPMLLRPAGIAATASTSLLKIL